MAVAAQNLELGPGNHSFVGSFSVWEGLEEGGLMGFATSDRGEQQAQANIG